LLQEALTSRYPVDTLVTSPLFEERCGPLLAGAVAHSTRHLRATPEVLRRMADCETFPEDGVLALCPLRDEERLAGCANSDAGFDNMPLDVALEGIADPGNLGTLLRCAAAVGMSRLWLTGEAHVDPYSPKVMRASSGYWFRVPLLHEPDIGALIERAARRPNGQVLASVPLRDGEGDGGGERTTSYWDVDFRRPTLVLLGVPRSPPHPLSPTHQAPCSARNHTHTRLR
jgi:TrmH family RNA methyltransferase